MRSQPGRRSSPNPGKSLFQFGRESALGPGGHLSRFRWEGSPNSGGGLPRIWPEVCPESGRRSAQNLAGGLPTFLHRPSQDSGWGSARIQVRKLLILVGGSGQNLVRKYSNSGQHPAHLLVILLPVCALHLCVAGSCQGRKVEQRDQVWNK